MGWINMAVGSQAFHNVYKAYVNVVNSTTTFVDPTPPTNTIKNYIIPTQCSIKQELKVSEERASCSTKIIAAVS